MDYPNGQQGKEAGKGGLAGVYGLVVRSGLAATRLVLSLHLAIVFDLDFQFYLYWSSVGRWERVNRVLKG